MGGSRAVSSAWPALALTFNAFTWGVSWWPFRELQARGLHPLWSTALIYAAAVAVITAWRPGAWRELGRTRSLWWLVAASGTTNAAFNWGVTAGDVVRVVLLFYLMPLWAVLLARAVLGEPFTRGAALRVGLALAGAAIVLWPPADAAAAGTGPLGASLPLPRTLPEWLGVLGGFTFALNNVVLKRESHRSEQARALAMFVGGTLVSGVLALSLGMSGSGAVPPLPTPTWGLAAGVAALAVAFLASNMALQYGAARLPANATAVVMITEVVFAAVSAVALGAGTVTARLAAGGALIVLASLLAARR